MKTQRTGALLEISMPVRLYYKIKHYNGLEFHSVLTQKGKWGANAPNLYIKVFFKKYLNSFLNFFY